jgi:predicted O-methyltransferase YrrM
VKKPRHDTEQTVRARLTGPNRLEGAEFLEHDLAVARLYAELVKCGLGYSALCLAHGSGALVETIERDTEHARLAELETARAGYGDRIRVICGQAADILAGLSGPYDLIFSDADPEEMPIALDHFLRLLRPRGLLVSANLFLAQFVPDLPGIEQMAQYRQRIVDDERLLTAIVPGGLALSCLRGNAATR